MSANEEASPPRPESSEVEGESNKQFRRIISYRRMKVQAKLDHQTSNVESVAEGPEGQAQDAGGASAAGAAAEARPTVAQRARAPRTSEANQGAGASAGPSGQPQGDAAGPGPARQDNQAAALEAAAGPAEGEFRLGSGAEAANPSRAGEDDVDGVGLEYADFDDEEEEDEEEEDEEEEEVEFYDDEGNLIAVARPSDVEGLGLEFEFDAAPAIQEELTTAEGYKPYRLQRVAGDRDTMMTLNQGLITEGNVADGRFAMLRELHDVALGNAGLVHVRTRRKPAVDVGRVTDAVDRIVRGEEGGKKGAKGHTLKTAKSRQNAYYKNITYAVDDAVNSKMAHIIKTEKDKAMTEKIRKNMSMDRHMMARAQSMARHAIHHFESKQEAAVEIQRWWRGVLARREYARLVKDRRTADVMERIRNIEFSNEDEEQLKREKVKKAQELREIARNIAPRTAAALQKHMNRARGMRNSVTVPEEMPTAEHSSGSTPRTTTFDGQGLEGAILATASIDDATRAAAGFPYISQTSPPPGPHLSRPAVATVLLGDFGGGPMSSLATSSGPALGLTSASAAPPSLVGLSSASQGAALTAGRAHPQKTAYPSPPPERPSKGAAVRRFMKIDKLFGSRKDNTNNLEAGFADTGEIVVKRSAASVVMPGEARPPMPMPLPSPLGAAPSTPHGPALNTHAFRPPAGLSVPSQGAGSSFTVPFSPVAPMTPLTPMTPQLGVGSLAGRISPTPGYHQGPPPNFAGGSLAGSKLRSTHGAGGGGGGGAGQSINHSHRRSITDPEVQPPSFSPGPGPIFQPEAGGAAGWSSTGASVSPTRPPPGGSGGGAELSIGGGGGGGGGRAAQHGSPSRVPGDWGRSPSGAGGGVTMGVGAAGGMAVGVRALSSNADISAPDNALRATLPAMGGRRRATMDAPMPVGGNLASRAPPPAPLDLSSLSTAPSMQTNNAFTPGPVTGGGGGGRQAGALASGQLVFGLPAAGQQAAPQNQSPLTMRARDNTAEKGPRGIGRPVAGLSPMVQHGNPGSTSGFNPMSAPTALGLGSMGAGGSGGPQGGASSSIGGGGVGCGGGGSALHGLTLPGGEYGVHRPAGGIPAPSPHFAGATTPSSPFDMVRARGQRAGKGASPGPTATAMPLAVGIMGQAPPTLNPAPSPGGPRSKRSTIT